MTLREAIKGIEDGLRTSLAIDGACERKAKEAVEWLKGQPDVPDIRVGKWIPVAEKLPEIGEEILITFSGKAQNTEFIHAMSTGVNYSDEGSSNWWIGVLWDVDDMDAMTVEAWMPLPEPYKEGEKNDLCR